MVGLIKNIYIRQLAYKYMFIWYISIYQIKKNNYATIKVEDFLVKTRVRKVAYWFLSELINKC